MGMIITGEIIFIAGPVVSISTISTFRGFGLSCMDDFSLLTTCAYSKDEQNSKLINPMYLICLMLLLYTGFKNYMKNKSSMFYG